jgi:pimeloyl-ACP methyl ester carboxylesterase
MPKIQTGDVELYYEEQGEGEPLVLIPGFANGLWIWFKQVPEFSKSVRVVTFDPRGIARSEAADKAVSVRMLADDVAALLDELKIESAHVLGASFGGFVAQEFALAYPQKTRSLILCCTSFGGINHVPPPMSTLEAIASTKGLNTEERVRENLLLAFSQDYLDRQQEEVQSVIRMRANSPVPEHAYLRQLQAAREFNTEGRVSDIAAPTLVITGDSDVIVPAQNSRNLAAKIPAAELSVIKNGSHTFFIEQADEFNRVVSDFVAGVAGNV